MDKKLFSKHQGQRYIAQQAKDENRHNNVSDECAPKKNNNIG